MRIENELPSIVSNYLSLQNNLDATQARLFYDIFTKISSHELKSVNIILNGRIQDGLSLISKQKDIIESIDIDSKPLLEIVMSNFKNDSNDIEKAYYIKGLTSLLDNLSYIDEEEQFLFNCLFEEITLDKKHLEENKEKEYIIA